MFVQSGHNLKVLGEVFLAGAELNSCLSWEHRICSRCKIPRKKTEIGANTDNSSNFVHYCCVRKDSAEQCTLQIMCPYENLLILFSPQVNYSSLVLEGKRGIDGLDRLSSSGKIWEGLNKKPGNTL